MASLAELKSHPKEEVLEMGGDFSMAELTNLGFLGYVNEVLPFRLIPQTLCDALRQEHAGNHDDAAIIKTVLAAFTIYRDSVNRRMFQAPLVLVDGMYEWPAPALFGWDQLDSVRLVGSALGAFDLSNEPTVSRTIESGAKVIDQTLNLTTGEAGELEVTQLRAFTERVLKYRIPKLAEVAYLNSQAWQNLALRGFAREVMRCALNLEAGKANPTWIKEFVGYMFSLWNYELKLPAMRFARQGEEPEQVTNLFIMEY